MSSRELLIQPLPWHVDGGIVSGQVVDANDVVVFHGVTRDEAEFIVRAVNSHQALVDALTRSLNWLASYPGGTAQNTYEQAKAALEAIRHDV
jgi:hypothetical protein